LARGKAVHRQALQGASADKKAVTNQGDGMMGYHKDKSGFSAIRSS